MGDRFGKGLLASVGLDASSLELLSSDVALILHQESLDRLPVTGASASASQGAVSVVDLMHQLRPRLEAARVRAYEAVMPGAANVGEQHTLCATLVKAAQ